jgi:tetratricopeptide (TPR) repeat protein
MKKFVIASVMAMAGLSLICTQSLRAQDPDQISISDQAEFNAYQNATTQSDPTAKAAALESFLSTYPQTKVKKSVLDMLVDTYQAAQNPAKTVDAATRLLQLDPNNLKAIFISVYIDKANKQWDDAATLAQKGLTVKKPVSIKDADWKEQTAAVYPLFHSALASQALNSKNDYKTAIAEFNIELQLTPADGTNNVLPDMLTLAATYADMKAKESRDLVKACWFYARVWDFAPANFKPKIEQPLEYWYKKYHGSLTGLDALKQQAQATMFPPGTLVIDKAKTPAEVVHDMLAGQADLSTLALEDKETILAVGSKDDADKLWAVMKDQQTPVPGIVIEASTTVIKIAVTADAKQAKIADFIVNLKTPLADKDVPAVGFEYKIPSAKEPAAELVGTYDSYAQVPATDTTAQAAVITLKDGVIVPAAKKTAPRPVSHKPAAAHPAQ